MFDFLKLSEKNESISEDKKTQYELAQQEIEELTAKAKAHKRVERVAERGKILNIGNHKVTGRELNTTTAHIDDSIIQTKKVQIETLKHIIKLYEALDALDEEHIAGILTALKAAEAASNSARVNDENIGIITDYLMDDDRIQKQDEKIAAMENRLKVAYIVAGSSLVAAIVSVLICLVNLL